MGPGMGAVRRQEIGLDRGASIGTSAGIDLSRESIGVRNEVDIGRSTSTSHEQGDGSPLMSRVRTGFTTLDVLRALNIVGTGALSLLNFSNGRPVMGALWGGVSVLWMVLALGSKSAGKSSGDQSGAG